LFDERVKILNNSIQAVEKAASRNHTHMMGTAEQLQLSLHDLNTRLAVIESKPQETLIRQVEAIHQEVSL